VASRTDRGQARARARKQAAAPADKYAAALAVGGGSASLSLEEKLAATAVGDTAIQAPLSIFCMEIGESLMNHTKWCLNDSVALG
jgi:hypothetical protein